jgi:hypothetical protein
VRLASFKENANFYVNNLQKCKYDGLKSMVGIQIQNRLDLDLFGIIQILQGALAVRGAIFQARRQIGILVKANAKDLRSLI